MSNIHEIYDHALKMHEHHSMMKEHAKQMHEHAHQAHIHSAKLIEMVKGHPDMATSKMSGYTPTMKGSIKPKL